MSTPLYISISANVILLILVIILATKHKNKCSVDKCPSSRAGGDKGGSQLTQADVLAQYWKKELRPPSLPDNKPYVYVSAPLFNLSELIYSLGIEGISEKNHVALSDVLCGLADYEMTYLRSFSDGLGLPRYGMAGLLAQKGWQSYIPARDGFVLAKFIGAVYSAQSAAVLTSAKTTSGEVVGYLTKAIYAFDVFALASLCNVCIFNSDGLQIDDGSAAEIGMIGVRGMPAVYFRDQFTHQFGVDADNPMPLGNANSLINQKAGTAQEAVELLDRKIKNIVANKDKWWAGLNYDSEVPPPPLVLYWIDVGNAVFNVRYRSRNIQLDANGLQDPKKSCTDSYYHLYYVDEKGNTAGSDSQLTQISINIMMEIQKVENKWKDFILAYGGCVPPIKDFKAIVETSYC